MDQGVRELALEPFVEEVLRKMELAEDGRVACEMRVGMKKWGANCRVISQYLEFLHFHTLVTTDSYP